MRINGKFIHRIEVRRERGRQEIRYWGKAGTGTPYIVTRRDLVGPDLEQAIKDNLQTGPPPAVTGFDERVHPALDNIQRM